MGGGDKISRERARGTSSGNASGNPLAIIFFPDSYSEYIESLERMGFSDARSAEALYIALGMSLYHFTPYLKLVASVRSGDSRTVKAAHDAATFDRRMQSVLFKYVGIVETQMRAQYSHYLGHVRGEFAHYDPSEFNRGDKYKTSFENFEKELRTAYRKNTRLKKTVEDNGGMLPIEASVEHMTLGTLSKFYSNTKCSDVTAPVAASFRCTRTELSSWLMTVTKVRNICAHFEQLMTKAQIPSPPLKIRGVEYENNKPLYSACVIARLLSGRSARFEDKNLAYAYRLIMDLRSVINGYREAYPDVADAMGVRNDWQSALEQASGIKVVDRMPQ